MQTLLGTKERPSPSNPFALGMEIGGSDTLHIEAASQSLQGNSDIVKGGNTAPFNNNCKFQGNFSDSRVKIYTEILPPKGKKPRIGIATDTD